MMKEYIMLESLTNKESYVSVMYWKDKIVLKIYTLWQSILILYKEMKNKKELK